MPYKVLPVLVGTLMFSPTLGALDSKENIETSKATDSEDIPNRNPDFLTKVHPYGNVFDDPQMGSTPYQPAEKTNY